MAQPRISGSGLVARTDFAAPFYTFPSRPPNGSLLVITGALFDGTGDQTITITDTDSGTWTVQTQVGAYTGRVVFIAVRENITGTAALTVTVSHPRDQRNIEFEVSAFSGSLTPTSYQTRSTNGTAQSTALTSVTPSTAAATLDANALVIAVCRTEHFGADAQIAGPAGSTVLAQAQTYAADSGPTWLSLMRDSGSVLAVQSVPFTFAAVTAAEALVAVFRPAVAGVGQITGGGTIDIPAVKPSGLIVTANTTTNSFSISWTNNNAANAITGHRLQVATAATGPWTTVATTQPTVTTYTDGPFALGAVRFYRVASIGLEDDSDWSAVVQGTIAAPVDSTPPTVSLSSSAATVTTASTLTLTATAADNVGVTEVRFFDGSTQVGAVTSPPFVLSRSITSADNGTKLYTARAYDAAGLSTLSNTVTVAVSIQASVVPVAAPDNLAVGAVTSNSIALTWTNFATNATGIEVWRRVVGETVFSLRQTLPATATSYTDTGLTQGSTHTYQVRAFNATTQSAFSQVVSANTTSAPGQGVLASVSASVTQLSGDAFAARSVQYTALDGQGFPKSGVTITPQYSGTGIASITPSSAITSAAGTVTFTVNLGATGTQSDLRVVATDGTVTIGQASNPAVAVFVLPAVTEALVKSLLEVGVDPRYSGEVTPMPLTFIGQLASGETLTSILSVECVPTSGADPEAESMLFGSPTMLSGGYVFQFIRSGKPGRAYYLRATCATSIGAVRTAEVRFRVYAVKGRRAGLVGGRVYQ